MKLTLQDLFDYLRANNDKTEFTIRTALEENNKVHFYIHPALTDGDTWDFYEDPEKDDFKQ